MLAVDTNVIVRLLTGDDARQSRAAQTLFASDEIWIAKTVLLETEWVLRSLYGFQRPEVLTALMRLLGMENVTVEDEHSVAAAMALTSHGIDFADAIHLTGRPARARFISFDKSFVNRAKRAGVLAVSTGSA